MAIQNNGQVNFYFGNKADLTFEDDNGIYYAKDTHELFIGSDNVSVPRSYVDQAIQDALYVDEDDPIIPGESLVEVNVSDFHFVDNVGYCYSSDTAELGFVVDKDYKCTLTTPSNQTYDIIATAYTFDGYPGNGIVEFLSHNQPELPAELSAAFSSIQVSDGVHVDAGESAIGGYNIYLDLEDEFSVFSALVSKITISEV